MKIKINKLNINYIIEGEGPPILFLHGWGSSLSAFTHIIKEFSNSFRCVAVDLPGFGESDLPAVPFNLQSYADFTVEFMKALDIKDPIMVGHSNGGRIIIRLLAEKKVNSKKIVLIDSAGIKPKKSLKSKVKLVTFKTVKRVLTLPLLKNYTVKVLQEARNYFGSADYNSASLVMRQTLVNIVNEDLIDSLPKIKASTLLIWGENDTATPLSDGKTMEKLIPDAGLCVVTGTGHFSFIERPSYVNTILASFLKGEKQ